MVEGYLTSLGSELGSKVRDRFPKTLYDAYQLSVMLEGNTLFHPGSQSTGKSKVYSDDYARVVSSGATAEESDLDELRGEVRRLREARDELYDEVNELKRENSSAASENSSAASTRSGRRRAGGRSQSVKPAVKDSGDQQC